MTPTSNVDEVRAELLRIAEGYRRAMYRRRTRPAHRRHGRPRAR